MQDSCSFAPCDSFDISASVLFRLGLPVVRGPFDRPTGLVRPRRYVRVFLVFGLCGFACVLEFDQWSKGRLSGLQSVECVVGFEIRLRSSMSWLSCVRSSGRSGDVRRRVFGAYGRLSQESGQYVVALVAAHVESRCRWELEWRWPWQSDQTCGSLRAQSMRRRATASCLHFGVLPARFCRFARSTWLCRCGFGCLEPFPSP